MGVTVRRKYHSRELGAGQLSQMLKAVAREVAVDKWEEADISITRDLPDGTHEQRNNLDFTDVTDVTDLTSMIHTLRVAFRNEMHTGLSVGVRAGASTWIPDTIELEVSSDNDESAYEAVQLFEQMLNLHKVTPQEEKEARARYLRPYTSPEETTSEDNEAELKQAPQRRTLHLVHSFTRGFLLGVGDLERLDHILQNRLDGLDDNIDVTYEVVRSDGLTYRTTDIETIVTEDNFESQAIRSITASEDPPFWENRQIEVQLRFSRKYGAELKVTGQNEDLVRLLFQDLKDYVVSYVAIVPDIARRVSIVFSIMQTLLIIGPIALFLVALAVVATQPRPPEPELTAVLESSDIAEKLNYLIAEQSNDAFSQTEARVYLYFFGWLSLLGFLFLVEGRVKRWVAGLYPRNVFLIGSKIEHFDRIIKQRENWKWVVVAGAIVNILAGLLLWWFTR